MPGSCGRPVSRNTKTSRRWSPASSTFAIPYTSDLGATLGQALALLGTFLFWSGLAFALRLDERLSERQGLSLAGLGVVLLLIPMGYLQTSPVPPAILSALLVAGAVLYYGRGRWEARSRAG